MTWTLFAVGPCVLPQLVPNDRQANTFTRQHHGDTTTAWRQVRAGWYWDLAVIRCRAALQTSNLCFILLGLDPTEVHNLSKDINTAVHMFLRMYLPLSLQVGFRLSSDTRLTPTRARAMLL